MERAVPLCITLDLNPIGSLDELHGLLQRAFSFPAHYGRNWDALWDCLSELPDQPMQIDLVGWLDAHRRLGWRMNIFLQLMTDFRASRAGKVRINICRQDA
ncbi:MAG: barstar family protein [Clostridia bacterium]|nr:barstar family protein [Clostridia bacterium]